jgi:outer membrane protein OmpA-like peptidoglycan-associated protein
MKYLTLLVSAFIVSFSILAQSSHDSYTDYKPFYTKFNDNYILDKIEYLPSEIILHFRYVSNMSLGSVVIYDVKGRDPWCLKANGKYYPLVKVSDVCINGKLKATHILNQTMQPFSVLQGEALTCKIHFKKLPKSIKQVDLIEGKGKEDYSNHFNCLNIKIKSFDDITLGSEADMKNNIKKFNKKNGISPNSSIVLNNIQFVKGSSELQAQSYTELDKLANHLKSNPKKVIEIIGHTCNTGSADANLSLSKSRAKAVEAYLKKKGVAANQLNSKGMGGTQPLLANISEANKEKNRRVEFKVIKE